MKQILDYSEFVEESAHADRDVQINGLFINTHFFNRAEQDTCPFCKVSTQIVHDTHTSDNPDWLDGGTYFIDENVWSCSTCGWWKLRIDKDTTGTIDAVSAVIKSAVLRKYDLSGKDIPISVLQEYLKEKFEDVIHINDKKMELLVQSVFLEHFNCEVTHVGKSSDGGIDLILVDSDSPTVVQVKRRKKLKTTEPVSCIRDFLGASLLAESKNLIYVSTCNKFSSQSVKATKTALDLQIVDSYELYDFARFRDVMKLTKNSHNLPAWHKFINKG
ncbi:restriction endonuclease [Shewanella oncorhynchi]|uniref:restriction endonuclease n=1 Tax=Shewanella oncorhynchi TaxID=2726434 RepID=UPI002E7B1BBA|nr:restriction endonuclease [Shewanella oncorhynchi]WVI91560.1 restriction endonuclease [Shewanella oncorhynchi]